jgi:hypothetical protein
MDDDMKVYFSIHVNSIDRAEAMKIVAFVHAMLDEDSVSHGFYFDKAVDDE